MSSNILLLLGLYAHLLDSDGSIMGSLTFDPLIVGASCSLWLQKAHSSTLHVPQVVSGVVQPVYLVPCPCSCGPSVFVCDYPL
jgi:hypothetical protein